MTDSEDAAPAPTEVPDGTSKSARLWNRLEGRTWFRVLVVVGTFVFPFPFLVAAYAIVAASLPVIDVGDQLVYLPYDLPVHYFALAAFFSSFAVIPAAALAYLPSDAELWRTPLQKLRTALLATSAMLAFSLWVVTLYSDPRTPVDPLPELMDRTGTTLHEAVFAQDALRPLIVQLVVLTVTVGAMEGLDRRRQGSVLRALLIVAVAAGVLAASGLWFGRDYIGG